MGGEHQGSGGQRKEACGQQSQSPGSRAEDAGTCPAREARILQNLQQEDPKGLPWPSSGRPAPSLAPHQPSLQTEGARARPRAAEAAWSGVPGHIHAHVHTECQTIHNTASHSAPHVPALHTHSTPRAHPTPNTHTPYMYPHYTRHACWCTLRCTHTHTPAQGLSPRETHSWAVPSLG